MRLFCVFHTFKLEYHGRIDGSKDMKPFIESRVCELIDLFITELMLRSDFFFAHFRCELEHKTISSEGSVDMMTPFLGSGPEGEFCLPSVRPSVRSPQF